MSDNSKWPKQHWRRAVITYRDFAPQQTAPGGLLKRPEFESLDRAVAEANAWIDSNRVEVVNIETVVLPNVWSPFEEGTEDADIMTRGDFATAWNQFVRVWYTTSGKPARPADSKSQAIGMPGDVS
jgi:hypothetical protein